MSGSDRRYYHYREAELEWSAFYLITTVSSWIGILLIALSVASGLFYLTDLAEDNSSLAKKILRYTIYAITLLHGMIMVVDGISLWRSLLSITTLMVGYLPLLRKFPWVCLSSRPAYVALVLFVLDNIAWYSFFLSGVGEYPFWAIVSFFFMMVWIVPAEFFVSLAVEDERLPASGAVGGGSGNGLADDGRRSSVWRSLINGVTGLVGGEKRQRN
ncbi:membrane-associated protein, putative [Bodo saltans]|uniref:Membrane-associated protein, putative n=1 Tax=Bodo saltans TaxID=75058 RepID=A0A0S4IJ23_BODSA|nr:membrane-associated protein, putative [Bodo saltans]|eukprot:CUE74203.1 membrane-associated protein, putative [Bodo saltans]